MDLKQIFAGDSIHEVVTLSDTPPSGGWTLKVRLTPRFAAPAQLPIDITASTSGGDYVIDQPPLQTSTWIPGAYTVAMWVEKSGARQVIAGSGADFTVKADPATTAAGYDPRSSARIALDAIEATLANKATTAQASYKINGREASSYSIADLLRLKLEFKSQVAAEERAAGIVSKERLGGTIRTRMVDL